MKHQYYEKLKTFLQKEITESASKHKFTNEQASETLRVSSRNYSNIKAGKSSCSTETLCVFIVKMCVDRNAFIERLIAIIEEAENELWLNSYKEKVLSLMFVIDN